MKTSLTKILPLCSLLILAGPAIAQESQSSTNIDFGTFAPSDNGTFVEIKVSNSLINMAARIARDSEPEVARILEGLNSIRVNVLGFDEEEAQTMKAQRPGHTEATG